MKQQIKNGIIFGLTAGIVFTLFGVVYAAWNDVVSNGDTVSASSWNMLVGKVEDMDNAVNFSGSTIQVEEICDETGANCQDISAGWAASGGEGSGSGSAGLSFGATYSATIPAQTVTNSCQGPTATLTIPEAGLYSVDISGAAYRYTGNWENLFLGLNGTDVVAYDAMHPSGYGQAGYMYAANSALVELEAQDYIFSINGSNGANCNTSSLDKILWGTVKAKKIEGGGSG